MITVKRISLSIVMIIWCFVACQREEAVMPKTDEAFVAGNIATVNFASDVEVNFIELRPGSVLISIERPVDASDQVSPALLKAIGGTDYAATYQKLAGSNADPASVRKLQAATARFKARMLSEAKYEKVVPPSESSEMEGARVQACSGGDNGQAWFLTNIWNNLNPNPGVILQKVVKRTSRSYIEEYASTGPGNAGEYYINVMNGQKLNSGNAIEVSWNADNSGDFIQSIAPWTYHTYIMPPNDGAWIIVRFVDPALSCNSTHMSIHWHSFL